MWPCGYQYVRFDRKYTSKAEWERGMRVSDLKARYMDQHVISTSSTRHGKEELLIPEEFSRPPTCHLVVI